MNKCIFSGRMVRDPELRKTQGGIDVCDFTIAVDRPVTKKEDKVADFFRCTAWGSKDGPGKAGAIGRYLHKGDGITVEGVMTTERYQDKETGKNVTSYKLMGNSKLFTSSL